MLTANICTPNLISASVSRRRPDGSSWAPHKKSCNLCVWLSIFILPTLRENTVKNDHCYFFRKLSAFITCIQLTHLFRSIVTVPKLARLFYNDVYKWTLGCYFDRDIMSGHLIHTTERIGLAHSPGRFLLDKATKLICMSVAGLENEPKSVWWYCSINKFTPMGIVREVYIIISRE